MNRSIRLALALSACLWSAPAHAQDCDEWSPIGDPLGRTGHAMAYDSARAQFVMFGGQVPNGTASNFTLSETWEYDGSTWLFRTLDGPTPRIDHAMSFDSARGVTVLFGGRVSNSISAETFAETWEWNGQTWTQRIVSGPPARYSAAMAFDSLRNVTLLYGGRTSTGTPLDDMWSWDGSTWTQIPSAPA